MITVELAGGLGNQMFQYAAAYALAAREGVACKVDLRLYSDPGARAYELDQFIAQPKLATPDDLPKPLGRLRNRVVRRLERYGLSGWQGKRPWFIERGAFSYDERFARLRDPVHLIGHFQSERYFSDIADEVRASFTFREKPSSENDALIAAMQRVNAVSIHVRRGDYVTNMAANRFHGTCDEDYYGRAIRLAASRLAEPEFFVFSDDSDWARAKLQFSHPTTFVTHNIGAAASQDMRLMSHCRHHIIANSSFSWWGAWLNPRADKLVIAPQRWVRDPSVDTRGVTPPTWLRC